MRPCLKGKKSVAPGSRQWEEPRRELVLEWLPLEKEASAWLCGTKMLTQTLSSLLCCVAFLFWWRGLGLTSVPLAGLALAV